MINALLTTAVETIAIFPAVVVAHKPLGIKVIVHPLVHPVGAVIVAIDVVPEIIAIGVVTAIVVFDATVGTDATTLSGTVKVRVVVSVIPPPCVDKTTDPTPDGSLTCPDVFRPMTLFIIV
jgi:hypothetical protein